MHRVPGKAIPHMTLQVMEATPSFHGAISSWEAENRLRKNRGNCYLTRYSDRRGEFVLSIYKKDKEEDQGTESEVFHNFNISITKAGDDTSHEVSGTEKKFKIMTEMLDYYKDAYIAPHIDCIGEECVNDKERLRSLQKSKLYFLLSYYHNNCWYLEKAEDKNIER